MRFSTARAWRRTWRSEAAWMETFTGTIGCGGCETHWLSLLTAMPSDYCSHEAYVAWTVVAHIAVDRWAGKLEVSMGAAKQPYRWTLLPSGLARSLF